MKSKDVKSIETKNCSAWLITFEGGGKILQLWSEDIPILGVVEATKTNNPGKKFDVINVSLGDFVVSEILIAWAPDGRGINQDKEIK
jgi:hypothetical protein